MRTTRAAFKSIGGVHPAYAKEATATLALEPMPMPACLYVSIAQHIGAPSKLVVKKGDTVARGQPIAEPSGFVSAWVHAPTSGTVRNIGERPTASGRLATAVEIEPDGEDRWHEGIEPKPDRDRLDAKALVEIVAQAGIIGMGGAGFPTHVKLSPPPGKTIDTLIINGAECEPYLTADDRLMVEQAEKVWKGAQLISRILGVDRIRIAVESNKPDAINAMARAVDNAAGRDCELVVLKTEYPQGAEKQLIYSVTGREVPTGGLPMDVGALVENVGTASAIYEAVFEGHPLIERAVTVTGDAVATPKNVVARVGTPFRDLVAFCGGTVGAVGKVISGGPMMGIAQYTLDAATNKTTSGLLLLSRARAKGYESMPCISCGRCVEACPTRLLPCTLAELVEAENFDAAEAYNVLDCIECGCCAFECPARRPLVQHLRRGKAEVTARRRRREAEKKKQEPAPGPGTT
ncbi:MAG: electron transport complex subunit RsxC [Kiritimatiellae bacterium]|nr:electron transport complex subunit RsxC [Kiritimatiellia bacterium]